MGTAALLLGTSFFAEGWFVFTLALSALLLVGLPIFWSALTRLFRGEWLDETFLMSLASIGAFAIGEYAEGVAVILFYLVGEEFEKRSVRRARKMIKSLIAPYKHMGIQFMPTGGITTGNVAEYLAIREIVAVGGTWLGKTDDITAGNWDKIRETVQAAVALKNGI